MRMDFTVLTIFPEMFAPLVTYGMVARAVEKGSVTVSTVNIRDFAVDKHRTTDDRPYGGGCGMVMKPEPLAEALRKARFESPNARTVLLSPQGKPLNQDRARAMAGWGAMILVCGRYEGIDERFVQTFVDEEISTGDYVVTGGELPAMIVIEAVARLIPGVLGSESSAEKDTFAEGLLEHGQYTRPREFEGEAVPEVLLGGNHAAIERWRREHSLIRTFLKRPDLLRGRKLSREEIRILKRWSAEIESLIEAQALLGAASSPGGQQKG